MGALCYTRNPKILEAVIIDTGTDVHGSMRYRNHRVTEEDVMLFALHHTLPPTLHHMCQGTYEKLSLLRKIRQGAQVLLCKEFQSSLLVFALVLGELDIVQWLIDHGPDASMPGIHAKRLFSEINEFFESLTETPTSCLYGAAVEGQTKVVEYLISIGVEVNFVMPDRNPGTALEAALLFRHGEIASILLQAGATCISSQGVEISSTEIEKQLNYV